MQEFRSMHHPPMPTVLPSAHAPAAALQIRRGVLRSGHARSNWKRCKSRCKLALLGLKCEHALLRDLRRGPSVALHNLGQVGAMNGFALVF